MMIPFLFYSVLLISLANVESNQRFELEIKNRTSSFKAGLGVEITSIDSNKREFKIVDFDIQKSKNVDTELLKKFANESVTVIEDNDTYFGVRTVEDDGGGANSDPFDPRVVIRHLAIYSSNPAFGFVFLAYIKSSESDVDYDLAEIQNTDNCLLTLVNGGENDLIDYYIDYTKERPCVDLLPVASDFNIQRGFFRMYSEKVDGQSQLIFHIRKNAEGDDFNEWIIKGN